MNNFDVVIIGSGPGGYVGALRCAQLGMKTALIEKYNSLGGTCLNVGCIPSKALLDSSEHFFNAKHNFDKHGIIINEPIADIEKMIARKREVVEQTCSGINYLMDKNKVTVYHGLGSFVNTNQVKVMHEDSSETLLNAKYFIIATGSKPNYFAGMEPDKKRIITSTEALEMKEIPKRLLVIGGGVIGLELGSVYARLGAEVEVIEFADSVIPTMDRSLGKELMKVLKKEGLKFNMEHRVQQVNNNGESVTLKALNKKGEELTFEGDYCLVSVGRKPYTTGLGLENAGVQLNDRGQVQVDHNLKTNVANIYAIGDVVRGAMLAHKAEEEGVFVAELLAGQKPHINYNLVPNVVYTWPEVAAVGKTEEELKAENVSYKVGNFPMKALGRSRASNDIHGFVKILADSNTDEVLGVHIIAARAADLIMEAVTAMEFRASAEDIARICHGHPTYSEAIKEAALDATAKRALHM
jgi:dihydrolipoamide dehydrogenase